MIILSKIPNLEGDLNGLLAIVRNLPFDYDAATESAFANCLKKISETKVIQIKDAVRIYFSKVVPIFLAKAEAKYAIE